MEVNYCLSANVSLSCIRGLFGCLTMASFVTQWSWSRGETDSTTRYNFERLRSDI